VIDVRDREEFDAGHIAGAITGSRGTVEGRIVEVVADESTPIVCCWNGGNRSALAGDTLQIWRPVLRGLTFPYPFGSSSWI
jgi:rhodanese-related sulfurtransferase